jgi:hypothetical protein
MNKKDLTIVALATFCLTATLFMIIPIRSDTPPGTYDPWVDTNDDGNINILESIITGNHFLTSGDSIRNVSVVNWPPANYSVVKGMVNITSSGGYVPFGVYCGGFSRLSILITPYWNNLPPISVVTIYLEHLTWVSDLSPSFCYVIQNISSSNVLNTTISGSGWDVPPFFMTETKSAVCWLYFNYKGQNLPSSWYVTFNYAIYMRSE